MTDREAFIATVRRSLRVGIPANPLRPLPDTPNDPIEYTADLGDPVRAFERAAAASGAELVPSVGPGDLVDRVFEDVAPEVVAVSGDPECDGIADFVAARGVSIAAANDVAEIARADLGVTGALAGVALTGSLVVDARRARGRLVSLLPKVHLVLVSRRNIVSTPGDVFRSMDEWLSGGLSSNLVFITGPSRSADIELEITEGVHGPQRVLIAVID